MPRFIAKIIGLFLVLFTSLATAQDDAALYFRRTHGGAWPVRGVDSSDQFIEASSATPSSSVSKDSPAPSLLDGGINAADLGKGDWIWQIPTCISTLGVGDAGHPTRT